MTDDDLVYYSWLVQTLAAEIDMLKERLRAATAIRPKPRDREKHNAYMREYMARYRAKQRREKHHVTEEDT